MTDEEHRHEREQDQGRWQWAIGLLVTVLMFSLLQLSVGVWWAADINARVNQVEVDQVRQQVEAETLGAIVSGQDTQIAVLASRIEEQTRRIAETNDLLREYLRRNGDATP